ncbi:MAG: DNA-3-methyladenine glycosylase 2 family protein [Pseudomonadota bacterium]
MTAPRETVLRSACETLAASDESLKRAYAKVGLPNWRHRSATYQSLAMIVVYQLISTKAADAIWARVLERHPNLSASDVLTDDADALLACGLSRPKLGHLIAIAEAAQSGALDFKRLAHDPIETARKTLISVRGIGPWTADTFLMTAIGHLDAFPHGDVGLMEAHKQLSGAEARLASKDFSKLAEAWRPYRAVAAHLLYDWLHSVRD